MALGRRGARWFLGLSVSVSAPFSADTFACTCASSGYAEKIEAATKIFRGYVTSASIQVDEVHFVVRVNRVLKGAASSEEILRTRNDTAGCGMGPIAVGAEYVFFLRDGDSVSFCSGSERLVPRDRKKVLDELESALNEKDVYPTSKGGDT